MLLVLLSGDVETNPGPLAPLARGPNLEKVHKMSLRLIMDKIAYIGEKQKETVVKPDKTEKTENTDKTNKPTKTKKTKKN